MNLYIINGPNLNLIGLREPHIYGTRSFDDYLAQLLSDFPEVNIGYFQSNHEGEIIDKLHALGYPNDGVSNCHGVILNAGAYTHTSLAIADAIAAIPVPVVEVHISQTAAREPIRHTSLIASVCSGTISGFGLESYRLAVMSFLNNL